MNKNINFGLKIKKAMWFNDYMAPGNKMYIFTSH